MASTFKASQLAKKLKQELQLRPGLSSLTFTTGVSSDGSPTIQIGTLATGTASAFIKIVPQDWPLAKDILGNAQNPYATHTIKLLTETAPGGTLTEGQKHQLTGAAALLGCELKRYQSTSGAGVVIADIDNEAKLVTNGTLEPDVWHVATSSQ